MEIGEVGHNGHRVVLPVEMGQLCEQELVTIHLHNMAAIPVSTKLHSSKLCPVLQDIVQVIHVWCNTVRQFLDIVG